MIQPAFGATLSHADEVPCSSAKNRIIESTSDVSILALSVAEAFHRYGSELTQLAAMHGDVEAVERRIALWSIARNWRTHVLVIRRPEGLKAAVILRERLVCGVPTGYFVGGDHMGDVFLLCESSERGQHLRTFVGELLRRKAFALYLQSDETAFSFIRQSELPQGCELQQTEIATHWRHKLVASFDDSIANFGRRTRRNLRHGLRSASQNGWNFIPDLTEVEIDESSLQIDRHAVYPATPEVLLARKELRQQLTGFFTAGLRGPDGQWLSTISGVRSNDGVTRIFWQHNRTLSGESICTIMRALLIEHEVKQRTQSIEYVSGTNDLMEHYCDEEVSSRAIFLKRGFRLAAFRLLLNSAIVPKQHVLRAGLSGGSL